MRKMPIDQFRSNLGEAVERVLADHEPLRVTRCAGADFVVEGAEDWEQERETLYVLENRSLMRQIARSVETHEADTGRRAWAEELGEIDRL